MGSRRSVCVAPAIPSTTGSRARCYGGTRVSSDVVGRSRGEASGQPDGVLAFARPRTVFRVDVPFELTEYLAQRLASDVREDFSDFPRGTCP